MNKNEMYGEMLAGKAKFFTGDLDVEHEALNQIRNATTLPILGGHVAVMADVHAGKGATVGTVLPTRGAVIPAAVGVDIGCGMIAVQTSLKASQLPDSLATIRAQIERDVPVGMNWHKKTINTKGMGHAGLNFDQARTKLLNGFSSLRIFNRIGDYDDGRMELQIGSLGSGNHFIELCLDTEQNVWVMLHSGSRNVGKTVGEAATEFAKEEMFRQHIQLPDKDLSWLAEGTPLFDEYIEAMHWCQDYAKLNRDLMLLLVLNGLRRHLPEFTLIDGAINCHHNFTQRETHFGESLWITRKGAVSAAKGQLGIIPGSMGTKSYIVCGKGHEQAYCTCSHGAGRRMSRGAAKRQFSVEDLKQQTAGVECRKDGGVLDEIPGAYKDIDAVMAAQMDQVEIKATLKQVMCIKG